MNGEFKLGRIFQCFVDLYVNYKVYDRKRYDLFNEKEKDDFWIYFKDLEKAAREIQDIVKPKDETYED